MTMTYEPIYSGKTPHGADAEGILRKRRGAAYIIENEKDLRSWKLVLPSSLKNTGVYRIVGYK